ncbi:Transient receptor potential cation channel protein painless-like protein [Temnothorax longispinosus]|uniref:Transient receptor potential cation channel protein painless-like protein n=1 Tax=Temnothorax longispinosus TaxID=300112 RepID=A0A4S2JQ59_9HYME|nr:Transient receptor potential cation channel protein painless-like protein [Temnothorax longispinosus]
MGKELSEKLPFKSENWKRDAQAVLEDCLKNRDETSFLTYVEDIQGEIPPCLVENLLTISAQHNWQKAVKAILDRFEKKHGQGTNSYLSVKEAARTAVQNGHYIIFEELLKVEPEISHHLILSVCLKLGEPRKRGVNDTLLRSNLKTCLELILKQINVDVCCIDNIKMHHGMIEMEQQTALHAVEKNDLKCADLLLEKGANAKIFNNKNLTAFYLTVIKGQRDMVKMMLDKYEQRLDVDKYKDYNDQATREVIEKKLPEMKKELSKKLPFKSRHWKVDVQDLKYYLKDETMFLKCMENIQKKISLSVANDLLTISAQRNLQQAVKAILKKFRGKHLNVRNAAHVAIQNGHHVILGELLKVEPEMANDLILIVCAELGVPGKQGVDDTSNLLKCLELILEQKNVDVRCTDKGGNTPLHYAAKADNRKAMSLLLKRGSYIGHMNTFNVPPIIHIPECTLSDYFNDCLKMTKNQTNENVIEFDYRCLMPHNIPAKQDTIQRATRETEVLLYIARNENLNHLLKHPLLSSFLYLKWLMIRPVLYANLVFYGIFYFLLNTYILSMTYKSPPNGNGMQTVSDSFDSVLNSTFLIRFYPESLLWVFVIVLWLLFTIWEILLFACCPRYFMNWENRLQVVLNIFTLILLCGAGAWSRVVVVLLSALVLTTLISQHPKISTNFEIFWIISRNYVYLLLPYLVLIIAFVLTFYILFENKRHFSNPGDLLFKTLIMVFTGEFNSNDIPVDSHPVLSRIVLVLFAFFIFVLVNVINGPAFANDIRTT